MDVPFGSDAVRTLAERTRRVQMAGRELAMFGDAEPVLASQCGVELSALEARGILAGGAPERVASLAERAAAAGRPVAVAQGDWEQLLRLEGVLSMAASRIELRRKALEAETSVPSFVQTLAPMLGGIVVDRAIGLIKSIF